MGSMTALMYSHLSKGSKRETVRVRKEVMVKTVHVEIYSSNETQRHGFKTIVYVFILLNLTS